MEKHAFNLTVMNKKFPVRATVEERETLKAAALLINEKIEAYKGKYNIKDEVYFALMCCLDLATENERLRQQQSPRPTGPSPEEQAQMAELQEKIEALHELLSMSWEELQAHSTQEAPAEEPVATTQAKPTPAHLPAPEEQAHEA